MGWYTILHEKLLRLWVYIDPILLLVVPDEESIVMEFEYADPDHIRHKRKWRRLTYDEKNRLVKLYKTGEPLKEIAKEIGIHPQSISAILRRRKVSRNRYFRTSM